LNYKRKFTYAPPEEDVKSMDSFNDTDIKPGGSENVELDEDLVNIDDVVNDDDSDVEKYLEDERYSQYSDTDMIGDTENDVEEEFEGIKICLLFGILNKPRFLVF